MANFLEALLSEEGEPGAYIPNAHENIDEEIERNDRPDILSNLDPKAMEIIEGMFTGGGPVGGTIKGGGKVIETILKRNQAAIKNLTKSRQEQDFINRTFKEVVKNLTKDVSKKTPKGGFPKGGASEAGVKEFIGKPTAFKYKALSKQDSKNKMIKELLTGSAIGFPSLLAMISHAKDWPGKLAEKLLPDPVEDYPIERNLPDMIEYYDKLEDMKKEDEVIELLKSVI